MWFVNSISNISLRSIWIFLSFFWIRILVMDNGSLKWFNQFVLSNNTWNIISKLDWSTLDEKIVAIICTNIKRTTNMRAFSWEITFVSPLIFSLLQISVDGQKRIDSLTTELQVKFWIYLNVIKHNKNEAEDFFVLVLNHMPVKVF